MSSIKISVILSSVIIAIRAVRTVFVPFDDLQRNVKLLYLRRHIGFMAFVDYPFLAVHLYNLIRGKLFHIHETQRGETGKNEQIPDKRERRAFKLMRHDGLQPGLYILRQGRKARKVLTGHH